MCTRFTPLAPDEVRDAVAAIATGRPCPLDPQRRGIAQDAFPKRHAPIVVMNDGIVQARTMQWGFELPGRAAETAFNTRVETAAASPLWRASFEERRCIVAAEAFFETHRDASGIKDGRRTRQVFRFASPHETALFIAGIWREGRFSVITCPPNGAVAAVHDRMPLLLSPEQAKAWLEGAAPPDACAVDIEGAPLYPPAPADAQLSLFG